MSSNSFKVKNGLTLSPIDLTNNPPLNPQAGDVICDSSDNNKIKRYDANAEAWVEVGSGGIGGVDIFFVQDFESASLSTFTQTGLTLTQTDPLKGKVSALLTHQIGASQFFKQVIFVDAKFRGVPMVLRLDSKSSAPQGKVTINIKDETNNVDIVVSEQLQLSNDTAGKKTSISFTIPATCTSISYTITALSQAGLPTTRIDDIICEIAETSLLETAVEVPVISTQSSTINQTATFSGGATITGSLTSSISSGIYSYNSSTGIYTVLKTGEFNISASTRASASASTICNIVINGTIVSAGSSAAIAGYHGTTSFNSVLNKDDTFYISIGTNGTDQQKISVFASAVESTTKTIPLTQSGIIQEADSMVRIDSANGFGSSSTTTRRFGLPIQIIGSDIVYIDSSTLGGQFIAQVDGIYNISYSESSIANTAVMQINILLNGVRVAFDNQRYNTANTSGKVASASWQGQLKAGDIITATVGAQAENDGAAVYFTMSKQGSLKQVNINPESKITIPTSELRFEGASARGTTNTQVVKFDTLSNIRGDAFTIVNTAELGTEIAVTKAGRLSINVMLLSPGTSFNYYLTKNSIDANTASAILQASGATAAAVRTSLTFDGFFQAGDVIRVIAGAAPSASSLNSISITHQEQDISVSVSNTLPQFSDSDSCVQLDGAGAIPYGSTATTTRRFASVIQNIGTDIEYVDSPTLGGQFIAKSSGIYNVSYTESSTANTTETLASILKNGVTVATDRALVNTATATSKIANPSWQGYLSAGDIITGAVNVAANNNGAAVYFTISKVGKPNVTGVDVTPFVNVPQPESQSLVSINTGTDYNLYTTTTSKGSGLFSVISANEIKALKNINVILTGSLGGSATATGGNFYSRIRLNGTLISEEREIIASSGAGTNIGHSVSLSLNVGDVLSIAAETVASVTITSGKATVLATALSDQILTQPETFSTDTASLQYASSSAYTLSTLANAPVGTYITFTYAANTNTRTQTTLNNRPSQTDADMNANGILLYPRAYTAPSTAAQPSTIAIQIGKGLKGVSLNLYKSAGKVTGGQVDHWLETNSALGIRYKDYNENTGILFLDAGAQNSANNTAVFQFNDITSQTSGYLVINASKNPALTGIGLNRIAAHYTSDAGQAIGTTAGLLKFEDKILDTTGSYNTSTGVYTIPEDGIYEIAAAFLTAAFTPTVATQGVSVAINVNSVRVSDNVARVGSTTSATYPSGEITYTAQLKKGDEVTILGNAAIATTMNTLNTYNRFIVKKVSI